MTDQDIRQAIAALWSKAAPVGPLHSDWDLIIDAEEMLAGRPTLLSRDEIIELLKKATA